MLQPGQYAPSFILPDADMESVALADFAGQPVVLFFYPRDGAPSSAQEALAFSDLENEFARCNCRVFGISPDDCLTHAEFRDEQGISVNLLADSECDVAGLYDVLQYRECNGDRRKVVQRATYVIDGEGVVRHAVTGATQRGHAHDVLELVRALDKQTAVAVG